MSNQAEIDYEKQFQDDLAKATALSLEEQKLDEYRRIKKYGNVGASCERSNSYSSSSNSPQEYYAQLRARHLARESSTESTKRQTPPPPTQASFSQRRYSEVSHNAAITAPSSSYGSSYNVERSRTPPPTAPRTTKVDNDLISWAGSPTSTNNSSSSGTSTVDHASFEKLIEDLQKIQTNPQTALVPLGPTAAAAAAANPMPYGVPTYGMPQPQYVAGAAAATAGMQMVPYQASTQQQKIPLTNQELEKLYNMPLQQQHQRGVGMIAYHPHMPHGAAAAAVMPGYYAMPYSAPIVPGSAAYMPPQYPPQTYGFQYTPAATYQPATAATQQQQPQQQRPHSSPVTYMPNSAQQHSNHLTTAAAAAASSSAAVANGSSIAALNATRRQSSSTTSASSLKLQQMHTQRTGNDLIDLNQEDDSRVSVLEAFDPLLNDDVSKK